MDFYKDRMFQLLLLVFLAFAYGVVAIGGWLLIVALIFFGFASMWGKEPHIKLSGMIFLVLLALINIYANGMIFGIDFVGGTRIPVLLEHSVDKDTMNELVQTIKSRVNTMGLKEVKAVAVGDSLINVEIASTDEATIAFIEEILPQQGVFQGIVDGKVAVSGDHIFRTTIRPLSGSELVQQRAEWGVGFSVDKEGGQQFASAAKGKADYPVYLLIDRPTDAALFYERETFKDYILADSGEKESIRSLQDMLALEGSNDIPVYMLEDLPANLTAPTNKTEAIVSENLSAAAKDDLKQRGYVIVEFPENQMAPEFQRSRTGVLLVNKLEAAGLLTAPLLGGSITSGVPNYAFVVTGGLGDIASNLKAQAASDKVKEIETILKGGALPVQISLGSRTMLPASLGMEFLKLSIIAVAASLVLISVLIGVRYRNVRATLPIVLISLAELTILLSILGSFTIDLAAVAGIIAAIGVGVDAQIVITDELLKRDEHTVAEKVDLAFGIIRTNAIVAIFSMMPLIFSHFLEIRNFAMSTILGALLGYLLTRPAYAVIVEKTLAAEKKAKTAAHTKV
jgi:preprotein translocase subunit SecD